MCWPRLTGPAEVQTDPLAPTEGVTEGAPMSPCVNRCRLDSEVGLCTGCGRNLDEIARWSTMQIAEQRSILNKLPQRLIDLETNGCGLQGNAESPEDAANY